MPHDPMALTQCNFRLPRWIKNQCAKFAEVEHKTLEGWLQDAINESLDNRLDDIEAEARAVAEWVGDARMRQKYARTTTIDNDR